MVRIVNVLILLSPIQGTEIEITAARRKCDSGGGLSTTVKSYGGAVLGASCMAIQGRRNNRMQFWGLHNLFAASSSFTLTNLLSATHECDRMIQMQTHLYIDAPGQ